MCRLLVAFLTMAVAAGSAGAEEAPQLRKHFETLDLNRDGLITQRELKQADAGLVRALNLSTDRQFQAADLNEDGTLNEAEFSAFETPFPVE